MSMLVPIVQLIAYMMLSLASVTVAAVSAFVIAHPADFGMGGVLG